MAFTYVLYLELMPELGLMLSSLQFSVAYMLALALLSFLTERAVRVYRAAECLSENYRFVGFQVYK